MADNHPTQGQANQQQIQFRIDEARMHTAYANTIRTTPTGDEVILDFGINLPSPGPDGKPMLVFDVGSRVVLNWRGAKRLAVSLSQIVRQFEEANGEIPLGNQQQQASGPRMAH